MFDKIARDGTLATDLSKVSFSVDLFNYFNLYLKRLSI